VEKQGQVKTFAQTDSLAIPQARDTGKIQHEEVQVERDPETGRILRVVRAGDEAEPVFNPLNDPLNELETAPQKTKTSRKGIVAELEKQAAEEAEKLETKRRPRQQSTREEEWIASLVAKHGDNIPAMVRDKKLNPMQQTQGDIGRRVKKWKAKQEAAT
jgi:nucleolar protein 16